MKSYLITQITGNIQLTNEQQDVAKQVCLLVAKLNGTTIEEENIHSRFNKAKELISVPRETFKVRIIGDNEMVIEELINNEYLEILSVWKIMAA